MTSGAVGTGEFVGSGKGGGDGNGDCVGPGEGKGVGAGTGNDAETPICKGKGLLDCPLVVIVSV